MSDHTASDSILVGIDVAKEKLDLARSDRQAIEQFDNTASGIAKLVKSLKSPAPKIIVVEATGGLERPLIESLLEADLPVARVNPAHVYHLAKGLGIMAKTDPIDARKLVAFARHAEPRLLEKRSENRTELKDLLTCRRQLINVRTEQANQRRTTRSKAAQRAIDSVLKNLDKQIDKLDQQIDELIDSDEQLRDLDRRIQAVPGVGRVLSTTLLAELIELGQTDRRAIGALVGVAPFNRDSGRCKGKRAIRGGRAAVRCVLYMATRSAMTWNPVIARFAKRLTDAGKADKVVVTACMRKLLTLLNAMIRDKLEWSQLKSVQSA